MFLLSKIIAKSWFKSLIACLVILFLLITVGDIINGYLRGWETKRVFFEYSLKLPFLMGKLLPICALLSTLFSVNGLKTHSELIAILAAGFSAKKIYRLILVFSFSIAFLQFINVGYLQPYSNKIKNSDKEQSSSDDSRYLARSKIGNSGILWHKSKGYFSSFALFDRKSQELKDLSIYYLSEDGLVESIFKSKTAKYDSNNLWLLKDLEIFQNLSDKNFPVVKKEKELLVSLEEKPSDFVQFESDITTLNIFKLATFINRLKSTGINYTEYEIMLLEKISNCIICVIFSLFPLISIFNPNRRSSSFGKSIVLTLSFTIVFWGVYSASISLGSSGKIPPLLATMGIPFIFSLFIGKTYFKNKKL